MCRWKGELVNIWAGTNNTTTLAKCVPDQHAIISFNVLGLTRLSPAWRHFAVATVLAPLTRYFRNCGIMNNNVSLQEFTAKPWRWSVTSAGSVKLSLRYDRNNRIIIDKISKSCRYSLLTHFAQNITQKHDRVCYRATSLKRFQNGVHLWTIILERLI